LVRESASILQQNLPVQCPCTQRQELRSRRRLITDRNRCQKTSALESASSPAQWLVHAALACRGRGNSGKGEVPSGFGGLTLDVCTRRDGNRHLNLGYTNMARLSEPSTHPSLDDASITPRLACHPNIRVALNLTTRPEATAAPPPRGGRKQHVLQPTCITTPHAQHMPLTLFLNN